MYNFPIYKERKVSIQLNCVRVRVYTRLSVCSRHNERLFLTYRAEGRLKKKLADDIKVVVDVAREHEKVMTGLHFHVAVRVA